MTTFSSADAVENAEILAGGESGLAIWHFNGTETYKLSDANPPGAFDVDGVTGEVEIGSGGLAADTTYTFDLQLIGGESGAEVTATRAIQVIVDAAEPPSGDALMIEPIPDTVTVAANAGRGDSVLTLSLRGGVNSRFSSGTNNHFDNTGRSEKTTVSLTRAAADVFNSNGATRSFIVKALADGEAATITAQFVSAPRAISPGSRAIVLLAANAVNGGEVLAAEDSGLSIWHNGGGAAAYSLQGDDDNLFSADSANGKIAVEAASLPLGIHDFELLLVDAARDLTATLELQVNVVNSLAEEAMRLAEEAVRVFLEEIESGERQWRGDASDWDEDGVANPYDWTPDVVNIGGADVSVNLTLGADGSAKNPWPIYNVWQLQAINGVGVSRQGTKYPQPLFGSNPYALHYRLATDIDATPTRIWSDGGFTPIGAQQNSNSDFTGSFDGAGREIRGLSLSLNDNNGGLFYKIGSGATVSRLGLPDVKIRGNGGVRIAALAHENDGLVSLVWATGDIAADSGLSGGLVRSVRPGGRVRESWFVGRVRGRTSTGGLVGYATGGDVMDSWAVARVEWSGTDNGAIGGLVGGF